MYLAKDVAISQEEPLIRNLVDENEVVEWRIAAQIGLSEPAGDIGV